MHNKPNTKPLCSSTKSGKLIDRIIYLIPPQYEIIKTNLCDLDYLPTERKEILACNLHWGNTYQPTSDDIVILLGNWVQKNFLTTELKSIKIKHPSSQRSWEQMNSYVFSAVEKILKTVK